MQSASGPRSNIKGAESSTRTHDGEAEEIFERFVATARLNKLEVQDFRKHRLDVDERSRVEGFDGAEEGKSEKQVPACGRQASSRELIRDAECALSAGGWASLRI